jgi:predicted GIY-YIG superfamily endonuclease
MYFVYVLFNKNNPKDNYLGYTSDLEKRVKTHDSNGNVSTRGREWELVYYEAYINKQVAQEREKKLKQDGRVKRYLMERIRKQF